MVPFVPISNFSCEVGHAPTGLAVKSSDDIKLVFPHSFSTCVADSRNSGSDVT